MSDKEDEEPYSAYMTFHSQYITVYALFSGFIFGAIVVVLAEYPNVAQIHAQAGLLVLNGALDLFLYALFDDILTLAICIRVAPKLPALVARRSGLRSWRFRTFVNWILLAAVVPILFFLWNLLYLSLASAILGALTLIAGFQRERQFTEFMREHTWIRK